MPLSILSVSVEITGFSDSTISRAAVGLDVSNLQYMKPFEDSQPCIRAQSQRPVTYSISQIWVVCFFRRQLKYLR